MPAAEAAHAGADVGHARQLEQALDGAVLAEGAVQDGEVDVGPRDHLRVVEARAGRPRRSGCGHEEDGRAARRRRRSAPSCSHQPPAWSIEHGQHVVPRGEPLRHRGRRAHAHLVLAGAAAEEQRDLQSRCVIESV